MDTAEKQRIISALKRHYKTPDVSSGKGGFFVRGKGWISLAKARRITGIKAKARTKRGKSGGYGDYAILRKIAGRV